MADTLENLKSRKVTAAELRSVVRAMKAISAANINQYETAVKALTDYTRTVSLAMFAYLKKEKIVAPEIFGGSKEGATLVLAFGSDQGFVGQFNESLAAFVAEEMSSVAGEKVIWAMGARLAAAQTLPAPVSKCFELPHSVDGITTLVNELLKQIVAFQEDNLLNAVYVFHHVPDGRSGYIPASQKLLPLDAPAITRDSKISWPTKNPAEVIGAGTILVGLLKEHVFVLLYKACAESLASENASRLAAMQRAEKNIDETMDSLERRYSLLRQAGIDDELFDVVAGSEALKTGSTRERL